MNPIEKIIELELEIDISRKETAHQMLRYRELLDENKNLKQLFNEELENREWIFMLSGKKKLDFQVSEEDWEAVRFTAGFKQVQSGVEKRQKVLKMLFRSAFMQLEVKDQIFFNEEIPQDFNDIKIPYRNTLSSMFEVGKNVMMKNKSNKQLMRKITQQTGLENLDESIHQKRQVHIKQFIKQSTKNDL